MVVAIVGGYTVIESGVLLTTESYNNGTEWRVVFNVHRSVTVYASQADAIVALDKLAATLGIYSL